MGSQFNGINKMSDADAFRNLLLHLRPEVEEETGSAGEQPASNRLPRYAERACGTDGWGHEVGDLIKVDGLELNVSG